MLTTVVKWSCLILGSLVFVAGCLPSAQTEQAKFYLLRSTSRESAHRGPREKLGPRELSVGVGPVDLPQYLDRPQIVTRTAGSELTIHEFDRWAERLQDNFTRVMANNIGLLLNTGQVFVFPWGSSVSIDYQVKMEVSEFIGQLGGPSSLAARWSIIGDDGTNVLLTRRSQFQARAPDATYEGLVTAMNETLTNLSREVADAIRSLAQE